MVPFLAGEMVLLPLPEVLLCGVPAISGDNTPAITGIACRPREVELKSSSTDMNSPSLSLLLESPEMGFPDTMHTTLHSQIP